MPSPPLCPHPEAVGIQVQKLHRIMPSTDRFFVCRQPHCTPEGSYYGLNTDWISTEEAGGWRWACPACGTPYNPGKNKPGLIPANHLWHLEESGEVMLAEWPESLEERAINEAAVKMAEHAEKLRFTDLSQEELQLALGKVVASHGVKAEFVTRQLSPGVMQSIDHLNAIRGKQKAYSYRHLQQGYRGGFFKYVAGETPVMKADGVKDFLAFSSASCRRPE